MLLLVLYALPLVPVLRAVRPDPDLVASRWSYIPSAFLSILIAYVAWSVIPWGRRPALAASAAVCGVFLAMLVVNNQAWVEAAERSEGLRAAGERAQGRVKYPVIHRGAYIFFSEQQLHISNSPLFGGDEDVEITASRRGEELPAAHNGS